MSPPGDPSLLEGGSLSSSIVIGLFFVVVNTLSGLTPPGVLVRPFSSHISLFDPNR